MRISTLPRLCCALLACCLLAGCGPNDEQAAAEQPGQTKPAPTALDTTPQGWGQGKRVDDSNRPVDCLTFQQKYGQYDAWFIRDPNQKTILLTFDEGYENGYTAQILDVLKEKQVRAVFFITGDYVDNSPELVRRMTQEGHTLGNHTENHPSMASLSPEKIAAEIGALHQKVEEQFGVKMRLLRPPKGEFSERSLSVTQQQGYASVFWSFAYADWNPDKQPEKQQALRTLTERLHPGAIYLLHAVSQTNAAILGDWIDAARAQGYTFEQSVS